MTQELKLQCFKFALGVDPEFEMGEHSCILRKKEASSG